MNKFGIGQPVRRVEDARFLTGRGRYVEDIDLPHQAYAALVLSPHAHALVSRVDASKALAAPGVLCVLTGADVLAEKLGGLPPQFIPEDMGGPKGYRTFRPILATGKVRFVGDRVAFVVAETAAQARDAAELVEVDYAPLPAVVRAEDALADGAPKVWDEAPGNVAFPLAIGNKEAADAVFARAHLVVRLRLENNRLSANALEPRGAIGEYSAADDAYTLYTSTQNPHGVRSVIAQAVFRIPETGLRVVANDVGGGFGMKGDTYPEEALVLWASRRCGRPVKWIPTRSESLASDDHGRDQVVYGEMALDASGRILAMRSRAVHGIGACVTGAAVVPVLYALKLTPNAYAVPVVHVSAQAVFTNTTPTGPYRGAGRPEGVYLAERLLEQAAIELGIDRVEIRRRNLVAPAAMPYASPTGFVYDSGEFATAMERCLALADWQGFEARRIASERRGRRRGRALTYYIEDCGVFNERMELRFDPGGTLTIVAGTFSHGQGHATAYAQMVSDWLGVPFESIRLVQGDTNQVSFGRGTYASRSVMLGGGALRMAANLIVEKAKPLAAHLMEAAAGDVEFEEGSFRIKGTDRAMPLTDVAKAFYRPVGLPKQFGVGLEASGFAATEPPNFPNGCHVCEVEVDPETGHVTIDRYAVVDDVGVVINPLICEGQVQGGLAQGIGQALLERVVYDRDSGQLVTGTFADYGMPRSDDVPATAMDFHNVPCKTNPLGVKSIGEAGSVGAPPTVINAVLDALRPLGVAHIDMPATPLRVWEAIRAAQTGGA
ncbi:MAG: xanthine dehydrogenase family protein molybdopterin-binding subunit [Burkholderiales bacterium]|nr:xanthine dehydrogenase family protein molybdopterin-binding subunit [Burkholderiales bacterium]